MRHYSLIPVRYDEQQLLVPCEPVDAELWSIQWIRHEPDRMFVQRAHWFADLAPTEYDEGVAIVQWLNNRQVMMAALDPVPLTVVTPSRSK